MLPDHVALTASSRAAAMPPFHAMAMAKRAHDLEHDGREVLHLELGQPSTRAPAGVRRAAANALEHNAIGYTSAEGVPALRRRIARHYGDWYGVDVEAERIIIVAGASAGFSLSFLAAFDLGARVGVVEPGYPCYRNALLALGCTPVPLPVDASTRWAPTPAMIEAAGPLGGIVLASPSNPTGTVAEFSALAHTCRERGIRLISDEIYHGITFESPAHSALEVEPSAVVVNSFSKYFSMTGWRLGWVVVPPDLIAGITRLQQNFYICAPSLSQFAAIAAFDCHEELRGHVERYASNRALLLRGLADAGITSVAAADGAFYVYADVSHLTDDSMGLCLRWLTELGLCATPGIDFDPVRGQKFVRFSYAGRADDLARAGERLADWVP